MGTIPFTPGDVKEYLDGAVTSWREKLMLSDQPEAEFPSPICLAIIDAYQSVRVSLFGEPLPSTTEVREWIEKQPAMRILDDRTVECSYRMVRGNFDA